MRRAVLCFLALLTSSGGLPAVTSAYSFDDPGGDHTNEAIRLDGAGDTMGSLRAFQAAARFAPTANSWTNLAVCLQRFAQKVPDREQKTKWYHKAHNAISKAGRVAVTDNEWAHYKENLAAVATSMRAENVAEPEGAERKLDPLEAIGLPAKPLRQAGAFSKPGGEPWGEFNRGGDKAKQEKRKRPAPFKKKPAAQQASGPHRSRLQHQRNAPLGVPMPRVSVQDLDGNDPAFQVFRDREQPFILTNALVGWGVVAEDWADKWAETLTGLFPNAVTDFYPHNMLSTDRQNPYLTRLPQAIKELAIETGPDQRQRGSKFDHDPTALAPGRYMHLQLTPAMWKELEARGDISKSRHWHLSSDEWLENCLGFPDNILAEEYHLKTHWKILLAGSRGAGMFNHSDSLLTSSWHAHLTGSKWWYVCGTLASNQSQVCYEDYLEPGETLYYGHGWHHETQNLETPTITLTDTVAHEHNFKHISDMLHGTCIGDKLRFQFSAKLCDALDECFAQMHEMFEGRPKPADRWLPWRSGAPAQQIADREAMKPEENNYDGRNYITEPDL